MEGASFKEVGEDDFNYEDLDLEAIGKDLGHDLIQAEEENVREANKNDDKEESDEDVYEVEDILDKKWSRSGQQLFLVKWVGFGSDQNTWEPEGNLQDCKEKLIAFKRKDDTWVPEEYPLEYKSKPKLLKRPHQSDEIPKLLSPKLKKFKSEHVKQEQVEGSWTPWSASSDNKGCWDCDVCGKSVNKTVITVHMREHYSQEDVGFQLHFDSFNGTECKSKGIPITKNKKKVYFYLDDKNISNKTFNFRIIEVRNEVNPRTIKNSFRNHLHPSENLIILIPESFLKKVPEKLENFDVPYEKVSPEIYHAEFPSLTGKMVVRVNRIMGNNQLIVEMIRGGQILLVNKSRFKQIMEAESIDIETELKTSQDKLKRSIVLKETAPDMDRYKTWVSGMEEKKTRSPMSEDEQFVYSCPVQECSFVSTNKYVGVRVHMVKHFPKEIRANALSKMEMNPLDRQTDIFQCMSGWNCSIQKLEARDELVPHYGLIHCLVDLVFLNYLEQRLAASTSSYLICPFDMEEFGSTEGLAFHLTTQHYLAVIREEVGTMMSWNRHQICRGDLQREHKCPYCVTKFPVREVEGEMDVTEMVVHCGVHHNFSLYYLLQGFQLEPAKVAGERLVHARDVKSADPTLLSIGRNGIQYKLGSHDVARERLALPGTTPILSRVVKGVGEIKEEVEEEVEEGEVERKTAPEDLFQVNIQLNDLLKEAGRKSIDELENDLLEVKEEPIETPETDEPMNPTEEETSSIFLPEHKAKSVFGAKMEASEVKLEPEEATEDPLDEDMDFSRMPIEQLVVEFGRRGQGVPMGGRPAMLSLLEKARRPGYRLDVAAWNARFVEKKRQMLEAKLKREQGAQRPPDMQTASVLRTPKVEN